MKWIRFLAVILLCVMIWGCGLWVNAAAEPVELELPQDFDFSQSDQCCGHRCFHQAAAQEDGKVIVCAFHIDSKERSEETFKRN